MTTLTHTVATELHALEVKVDAMGRTFNKLEDALTAIDVTCEQLETLRGRKTEVMKAMTALREIIG